MEVFIEGTTLVSDTIKFRAKAAFQVLLGSLFLVACTQIIIPLYPVPITMQTLGIFLLAIMQGGKKASYSTLLYLVFACLRLPVLAGGTLFWWMIPTAGYLVAFPIAAYVTGNLVERRENPSPFWIVASILVGQVLIWSLGILGLMRIMNFEQSLMVGLVPFLPVEGAKVLLASSLGGLWLRSKRK